MSDITLEEVLLTGRQADPEGVTVIISRQACEEASSELATLRSQLAAALAKVEEYKLDAARYRWLRQPDIEMAQLFDWKQQKDGEHGLVFKSDAELDAAIDSAMTAKEGG